MKIGFVSILCWVVSVPLCLYWRIFQVNKGSLLFNWWIVIYITLIQQLGLRSLRTFSFLETVFRAFRLGGVSLFLDQELFDLTILRNSATVATLMMFLFGEDVEVRPWILADISVPVLDATRLDGFRNSTCCTLNLWIWRLIEGGLGLSLEPCLCQSSIGFASWDRSLMNTWWNGSQRLQKATLAKTTHARPSKLGLKDSRPMHFCLTLHLAHEFLYLLQWGVRFSTLPLPKLSLKSIVPVLVPELKASFLQLTVSVSWSFKLGRHHTVEGMTERIMQWKLRLHVEHLTYRPLVKAIKSLPDVLVVVERSWVLGNDCIL